ncbi:uncharacterized protein LOC129053060 [Pongo abelii]|uniref:uncharacterized protein LOC129053060 n=1 Tax=Pongo abelii TaxID=9601 RepID=UPI0023E75EA6|nr:uncharacterized protein LOC129053060 [Pongo abelii]
MSPLAPLENGAEIEELLKFHCKLFAKVSGICLRSCFAASESERTCKPARERERKEGLGRRRDRPRERHTDSDRSGARDLGDGEVAGREKPVYAPSCNPTTCPGQVSPSPLLVFHNAGSYFDFMHCPSAAML